MTRPSRAARLRLGLPFVLMHVACLAVFLVGWSIVAVAVAAVTYFVRAVAITAFYHRGFSHRAFEMRRSVRIVGAVIGNSAAQKGPLWWVGQHRIHHRLADQPGDPHSPRQVGFGRAHAGWQFDAARRETPLEQVRDLAAYPEMRFLDRFHYLSVGLALILGFIGVKLVLQAAHETISTAVPEIPSLVSLGVIVVVLTVSVVVSMLRPPPQKAEHG